MVFCQPTNVRNTDSLTLMLRRNTFARERDGISLDRGSDSQRSASKIQDAASNAFEVWSIEVASSP
jgi:hypothetical protein